MCLVIHHAYNNIMDAEAPKLSSLITPQELDRFLACCGDKAAAEAVAAANAIPEDNVGHRLLRKMGWKAGEGLGASQAASAITAPVAVPGATSSKQVCCLLFG